MNLLEYVANDSASDNDEMSGDSDVEVDDYIEGNVVKDKSDSVQDNSETEDIPDVGSSLNCILKKIKN